MNRVSCSSFPLTCEMTLIFTNSKLEQRYALHCDRSTLGKIGITAHQVNNSCLEQVVIVAGFCMQALYSSASVAERQRAALAAARDAQVRAASVRTDLALELPPTVALPEEHPLVGSLHLRDADQEQELYGACVRAPPNRTVTDSCPPCRSGSVSLLQRGCAMPLVLRSNSVGGASARCDRTGPWHGSQGSTDCERPGGV